MRVFMDYRSKPTLMWRTWTSNWALRKGRSWPAFCRYLETVI